MLEGSAMKIGAMHTLATAFLLLVAGCAADGDSSATNDENEIVIGLDDLADRVTVLPDRLVFDASVQPALERLGLLDKVTAFEAASDKTAAEPVLFVGRRQKGATAADGTIAEGARNPSGYLRRGVHWSKAADGTIVVKTEQATMAEAVEEMKRNGFVNLTGPKAQAFGDNGEDIATGFGSTDRTWRVPIGPAGGIVPIDLSGRELASRALASGGKAKIVLKTGKITLRPVATAHLVVKTFIPQMAEATIAADVDGAVEFEATGDGGFDFTKEATLFKRSWGRDVGGLPLTLAVEVGYSCQVATSGRTQANAGATAKGALRAGAAFEGLSLRGILDRPTYEFGRIGPTVDSSVIAKGVCHLTSKLALQLFDAAGPEGLVDLAATLDADASQAQLGGKGKARLIASVDAQAGGTLQPFGFKLADIKLGPFHSERQVFDGEITVGGAK
jgi:hypothetical protein